MRQTPVAAVRYRPWNARRQRVPRGYCLAVALVLACFDAHGQVDDRLAATSDLKKLSLEDLVNIEVTSVSRHPQRLSRTASAVQVITGEEIRRFGATSIPDALRLADNLDVVQKNSHDWAITARGFNTALANKLLVMIDGRTVYTPLFSGVFWDVQNYLLADIDRIEVISGPGGTQWGANAVNGVINIITKSAKDTQVGYFEANAGNQLKDMIGARYGGQTSNETYFRVYAQNFDQASDTFADGRSSHDAWNQGQVGFRLDTQPDPNTNVTVHGDYYRGEEDISTGSTEDVSGGNLLGRWTYAEPDGEDISLQTYIDRTHRVDPIPPFVLNGNVVAAGGFLTDDLDTFDVDFQHRFRLGDRQQIEWGLGYRYTHDDVANVPSLAFLPSVLNQNLYSGFIQDEVSFGSNITLTAGTKLEHNDYTGLEAEPSVRALWTVSDDQSLWAAISRAVRTPSRIDRDFSEPAATGNSVVVLEGSDTFISETVVADELGYRAQVSDSFATSISAFSNHYLHIRSTNVTPVSFLPLFFENNVEGHTYGLELSTDYSISDSWRLHASYDPLFERLRVKPGAFDFNAALNEVADPHDRFSFRSTLDLPHNTEFDTTLRWTAPRDINQGPTIGVVNSYWDLDLRIGWHLSEHIELSLVGQNLLYDHRAQYGFPGPEQVFIERGAYGKLVWKF